MGNCCDGSNNDYDIINVQLEKDIFTKKTNQNNQIDNAAENNCQKNIINKNNNSPSKLYISKKKLKLIIKQSKCLKEGKEIIINSLGLLNSQNNFNDGLTIFGDMNVTNK